MPFKFLSLQSAKNAFITHISRLQQISNPERFRTVVSFFRRTPLVPLRFSRKGVSCVMHISAGFNETVPDVTFGSACKESFVPGQGRILIFRRMQTSLNLLNHEETKQNTSNSLDKG